MEPQVVLHGEGSPRASSPATAAAVPQSNSRINILGMVKRVGRSRQMSHWDAEDLAAWEAGGKSVARRNLFWSIVIVHLGYAIWALWPVMALFMPKESTAFRPATNCCSV